MSIATISGPRQGSGWEINITLYSLIKYGANDDKGAIQVFHDWEMVEQSYHRKMSSDLLISVAAYYLYENNEAMFVRYALVLQDTIKPTDPPRWFGFCYLQCEAHFRFGFSESSLLAARICLDLAERHGYPELYYVARVVVSNLIKKDSAQQALGLMQRLMRDHPPRSVLEDLAVSYCYGIIYDGLGQAAMAEKYFQRVMRQDSGFANQPKGSIFLSYFFQPAETAIGIGEFYIRQGKFREARSYLKRVVNDSLPGGQISDRRMMELLLSRASQALGDYGAAMQYHQQYEDLSDSMIKNQKQQLMWSGVLKNISEVQRYRFDSSYLVQLGERAKLKRADFERKMFLAGSAILLLATAFLLWGYRMKKRNVFQLQKQQSVIHRQNEIQQQLIGEKDKLLAEKDLLMREIYHGIENDAGVIITVRFRPKERRACAGLVSNSA